MSENLFTEFAEPTPEKKAELNRLLEMCFEAAAFFGTSLHYYGRKKLRITFPGDTAAEMWAEDWAEDDKWQKEPETEETTEEDEAADDMDLMDYDDDISTYSDHSSDAPKTIHENPDPIFQLAQIFTLLHPRVKRIFGEESAVYQIFHKTLQLRGATGDTIEQQINGADRTWVISSWLITKQAFVMRHFDEMSLMLDTLKRDSLENEPKHLQLPSITDNDIKFLTLVCESLKRERESAAGKKDLPEETQRTISEIIATGNITLPISKPFRMQRELAANKGIGNIDVGLGAIVKAKITGADGSATIHLSKFEMDIEAAVGQIFQENGFHKITITPAQIYRKYAGMGPEDNVSPESIQKTIEAMDKLITTPATLDFTQQIEKHTKLKRRPHFDYESRSRKGTLISGVHDTKRSTTYKGSVVEDSFTIFDMPMFYAYSFAFGQMLTLPANLLTGEAAKPQGEKKIRGRQTERLVRLSSEEIGLRRYLLERIEYYKGLKEKANRKRKYNREKPLDTYTGYILFSSVAEEIGYELTPKRSRTLREQVYAFMQEQVKLKNIRAAEYHIKGKAYAGVKITL